MPADFRIVLDDRERYVVDRAQAAALKQSLETA